ncbi:hypothetical protein E4659_14945 [Dickeya dianthicola]|uniref:hypothetical protein n=1 Tax=Dickeya dianthicola TaxID=204039 RepID=UPI00118750D5|nr:hypothetical protein [Dickeya dianthicola]MBT1432814.1 hypothetical protein [Dickeya dianthicola]MBT1460263.1 hypothetical protein [Dickeya dianthicola]MBT1489461.1 hypothetical protein [Dickeya dianthicola]MCA7002190.1 hypothetical protein [Dickeya dianthicola]MCI4001704.1 hypothetical protein [Dickeya dianthicola]
MASNVSTHGFELSNSSLGKVDFDMPYNLKSPLREVFLVIPTILQVAGVLAALLSHILWASALLDRCQQHSNRLTSICRSPSLTDINPRGFTALQSSLLALS